MAKRRIPSLNDEDIALFHEAIGEVRRLEASAPAPRPAPPTPRPRSREKDEADALQQLHFAPFLAALPGPGDRLEYLKEGYPPRILRRLKRGEYTVQDELDLHRMTQAQAESALRLFLQEVREQDCRCVCIVHGKGLRSGESGAVLKALVDRLLRLRADVLAFASAPERLGGSGAVLVLLARG